MAANEDKTSWLTHGKVDVEEEKDVGHHQWRVLYKVVDGPEVDMGEVVDFAVVESETERVGHQQFVS